MKGRGIPSIRSKVRGDQYVTVNVKCRETLIQSKKNFCVNSELIETCLLIDEGELDENRAVEVVQKVAPVLEDEEDKNYKQKKSFAEKMKDFLNK